MPFMCVIPPNWSVTVIKTTLSGSKSFFSRKEMRSSSKPNCATHIDLHNPFNALPEQFFFVCVYPSSNARSLLLYFQSNTMYTINGHSLNATAVPLHVDIKENFSPAKEERSANVPSVRIKVIIFSFCCLFLQSRTLSVNPHDSEEEEEEEEDVAPRYSHHNSPVKRRQQQQQQQPPPQPAPNKPGRYRTTINISAHEDEDVNIRGNNNNNSSSISAKPPSNNNHHMGAGAARRQKVTMERLIAPQIGRARRIIRKWSKKR